MITVDASAFVAALTDDGPTGRQAYQALSADPEWAAPRHLVAETLAGVRGALLRGQVTLARADRAVEALGTVEATWVETGELVGRIWEMREQVTVYDAAYVAVAERLEVALVTTDAQLSRYPGARCTFYVLPGK